MVPPQHESNQYIQSWLFGQTSNLRDTLHLKLEKLLSCHSLLENESFQGLL